MRTIESIYPVVIQRQNRHQAAKEGSDRACVIHPSSSQRRRAGRKGGNRNVVVGNSLFRGVHESPVFSKRRMRRADTTKRQCRGNLAHLTMQPSMSAVDGAKAKEVRLANVGIVKWWLLFGTGPRRQSGLLGLTPRGGRDSYLASANRVPP